MNMLASRRFASAFSLIACVAGATAQAPWFKAPVMLDGVPGEVRLLGDIDGDQDLDVVAFVTSSSFTPLLNNGLGTFTAGATVPLPAGSGSLVAMADLDGDGFADMVTVRQNSSPLGAALLIHLGNASGAFSAPIPLALPGNVVQLLRGDADGDGIDDLLVMHFGAGAMETRWLHGDPTRTFPLGPSSTLIPFAIDVAVVRVDGDAIDDVVTVIDNPVGPDTAAFWVTTPTGFAAHTTLPIAAGISGAALIPLDFENDGDRDLLAVSPVASRTLVVTRLRNDAGGTWTVAGSQTLTNVSFAQRWFTGDWDGNGTDDVLEHELSTGSSTFSYHLFTTWRNDGTGVLTRTSSQLIPGILGVQSNGGAGPGDLNGDGKLDFADDLAVVFGDGTHDDPLGPQMLTRLDWDGDGDIDAFPRTRLGLNDGTGALVEHDLLFQSPPTGESLGASLYTDLDRDGLHEALVAHYRQPPPFPQQFLDMRLFRETPGFQFVDVGPATAPGQEMLGRLLVDDVDGDGDLDVIAQQGLWLNNGAGFFTLTGPGFGSYEPRALVDFDGDGDLDLVGVKVDGGTSVAVFYRTAPATYAATVLFPSTSTVIAPANVAVGDLDDDGDPDLVTTQEAAGTTRILLFENQGGVLSLHMTLQRTGGVAVGDVDGDGRADLCVSDDHRLQVLRRNGPWTFDAPVVFAIDSFAGLADVDQDGDLDACAQFTVQNRRFDGPAAGSRRQYGSGGIGGGGHLPLLSVVGPVRPGFSADVRLRGAPGGALAALVLASSELNPPGVVLPGVTAFVNGVIEIRMLVLSGTPGVAGAGALDLNVPLLPLHAAMDVFLQCVVDDPLLPAGLGYSNGLEVRIGL